MVNVVLTYRTHSQQLAMQPWEDNHIPSAREEPYRIVWQWLWRQLTDGKEMFRPSNG